VVACGGSVGGLERLYGYAMDMPVAVLSPA